MNIAKFLANGTPEMLLEAIMRAHQDLRENESTHGLKASSDRWVYDLGHYRPLLIKTVKKHWSILAATQSHECPFTDDRIAHMYISCRKDSYTIEALKEDLKKLRRSGGLYD